MFLSVVLGTFARGISRVGRVDNLGRGLIHALSDGLKVLYSPKKVPSIPLPPSAPLQDPLAQPEHFVIVAVVEGQQQPVVGASTPAQPSLQSLSLRPSPSIVSSWPTKEIVPI